MKKVVIAILFLSLTADAQSFKGWWKHHHILCMCIGAQPILPGGN